MRWDTPPTSSSLLGVGVHQDQLIHRKVVAKATEPVDQLRRVRRAASDDCEFHPLTPVSVTPSMNAFCAKKNTMITGAITISVAAIVRFQSVRCADLNDSSP